jgi:hypothetical protein
MTTDLRNGSRQESRPSTTGPRAAAHRLIPKQKCVSVCVRESCCVRVRVCRCVCMSAARMSVCVYVRRESLVTCTHRTALINILYFTASRPSSTMHIKRHLISNNVSSLATPVFFVGQSRGDCWLQAGYFRIYRKWCDFSGARWSGAASGARPRHVRVRMVSRFSALQTKGRAKILQWRHKCERFPILCRSGAGTW